MLSAQSTFGDAFELFHETAQCVVGGIAGFGVADGTALGFVLIGGGGGEVVEAGDEGIEDGGGVSAFDEFGGLRGFSSGSIRGERKGDGSGVGGIWHGVCDVCY